MIYVLDQDGQPYKSTTRNGKVRRLLKEKKARVVKSCPFTIQLLYNPETDIRPNIMEGYFMNIIISNDSRFPSGLVPKNTVKMSLDDFMLSTTSNKGLEFTTAYVDIDSIDEKAYKMFNKMTKDGSDIKFFRYNTKPFIKSPVSIVNINCMESKKSELYIRLSDNSIITGNAIMICGRCGSGKTTLLKNIQTQLENKGTTVYYVSTSENSPIDVLNTIEEFVGHIKDRLNLISNEHVNNIYKLLNHDIKSETLIIDEYAHLVHSLDPAKRDELRANIDFISRLARAVGMSIIISSQTFNGCDMSGDLDIRFCDRIVVGYIDKDIATSMLKSMTNNINLTLGTGLYIKIYDLIDESTYNVFNINDVKTLM